MGMPRVRSYGAFATRSERAQAISFDLCRFLRLDGHDMVETMSVYQWIYDQIATRTEPVDLEALARRWSARAEARDDYEWLQRAFN